SEKRVRIPILLPSAKTSALSTVLPKFNAHWSNVLISMLSKISGRKKRLCTYSSATELAIGVPVKKCKPAHLPCSSLKYLDSSKRLDARPLPPVLIPSTCIPVFKNRFLYKCASST